MSRRAPARRKNREHEVRNEEIPHSGSELCGERDRTTAPRRELHALDALVRSERRLRRLVDLMNEGLILVDSEGRIAWVNRSLSEMSGYALDDLVGRRPTEFLDDDNQRIFAQQFESRAGGERERYEIDWIRKDGSRLSSLVAPQPLYDAEDHFVGSISVVSDITPLKQAQAALLRSERHFRELVDHASSIILRWDADGTIRFMNPYGLRFFGYLEGDIIGRNVLGTIVPETDSSGVDLVAMIADIAAHPERHVCNENETSDRDGHRFWVLWTNHGLRNSDGRVTEVLSIGTDITELKRTREALARQRDQLAELNDFIRRVFGRYVSDAVVRSLLDSPAGLDVGGTSRIVTILVADVRGFSSICDELLPEQVVTLLNTYLESMTRVIEAYGGTIDEFIGDAILVLFGAPNAMAGHAERAVACAVAMQLAMRDVNEHNRAAGLPELEIGIGIHTGDVVVGNIGSLRRAKYGVVGAPVNLASRIESYTVGGQVLISDETRAAAGEMLTLGTQIQVEPKGTRGPLTIHEILGIGGSHQLALPSATRELSLRPANLHCRYFVLEEKFVGRTPFDGRITRLSASAAELRSERSLPLLANLKLRLADDATFDSNAPSRADGEMEAEIYAKVIGHADPLHAILRFTSTSARARRFIDGQS